MALNGGAAEKTTTCRAGTRRFLWLALADDIFLWLMEKNREGPEKIVKCA